MTLLFYYKHKILLLNHYFIINLLNVFHKSMWHIDISFANKCNIWLNYTESLDNILLFVRSYGKEHSESF